VPRRAAHRGRSTPNALHSALPHTDPDRIVGAPADQTQKDLPSNEWLRV